MMPKAKEARGEKKKKTTFRYVASDIHFGILETI